ncbi:MAG: ABC transporter ATP-binding protein [Lactovum sp.]
MIKITNLTKDYGQQHGLFNLNLEIKKGDCVGLVGINGAGKTTTLRHLMGFLKADQGAAEINGIDCWTKSSKIHELVSYIPGEISFPDSKTGYDFLQMQAQLLQINEEKHRDFLIQQMQLDPSANLKRMSKGMKQKTAIVAALMADREILLLDEPTTGLDPLMRKKFLDLLEIEKEKGKTILMSSHMFEEVESICNKVALIKNGRIIEVKEVNEIKHHSLKVFRLDFKTDSDYQVVLDSGFNLVKSSKEKHSLHIQIDDYNISQLLKVLKGKEITNFEEEKYTLSDYFKSLEKELL